MNFPNLTRRGFVAAASALAATVSAAMNLPSGIKLINETDSEEPVNLSKDWITDKGDYYIVRVPEGKSFWNETLDKSTVFYIENGGSVKHVRVNGFVNAIVLNEYASLSNCIIDASKTRLASGKERSPLVVDWRGRPPHLDQAIIVSGDVKPIWTYLEEKSRKLTNTLHG